MSYKASYNFAKDWGDTDTMQRIREADKSGEVIAIEIENALKDMGFRFERAPNSTTIKLWAEDLSRIGVDFKIIKQVLKSVPGKMEKHPSLAEIMTLIRPYQLTEKENIDELKDLSKRCYPKIKENFLKLTDQKTLDLMIQSYIKNVFPGLAEFSKEDQEMCVLNDWLRCYFGDAKKIIDQGKISNEMAEKGNKDYFINPLKSYAKSNNL